MNELQITTSPEVEFVFNNYPELVRSKILTLRNLIVETAKETDEIKQIEETLNWGEPSYLTKKGSTIRIDWKSKTPNQYAMYFKCTSKLVPTFKMIYQKTFEFEGNRAIIFQIEETIDTVALKTCVRAALTYHRVKHLHTLNM